MIINVDQIKTGLKIEYAISGADKTYMAKAPAMRDTGQIKLLGPKENLWTLMFKKPPLFGKSSSLGISFGFKHQYNEFRIMQNETALGLISKVRYDKVKTRYEVSFNKSVSLIYPLFQGKNEILLVFRDGIQIAQIKRETFTRNLKDSYIIYIPDEFSAFVIPLLLFVLYYDHCEYGNRGEFRKGSVNQTYGYSYGEAHLRYDPQWMGLHFPHVKNTPLEIDIEKSKTLGRRLSMTQTILTGMFFVLLALFLIFVVGDPVLAIGSLFLYIILNIYRNRHSVD